MWNQLPTVTKSSSTLAQFRARLNNLNFTGCQCMNLNASEMTGSSKNKNESHFMFILKFRSSDEHKELHVGDDNQMTVSVTVINEAQDAAYSGRVIVTFPSIIDYASSSQVSWGTKVLLRLATVWSQLFHFLCCRFLPRGSTKFHVFWGTWTQDNDFLIPF